MFKLKYDGLREYQEETIQTIFDKKEKGVFRQLIHLPTGTGKTIIFANLCQQVKGRVLILTHRNILVKQAKEKILLVDPMADIGIIQAENNELDNRILLASVPTIGKEPTEANSKDRLLQIPTDIELIIVDEAHHSIAPTWRRVFQRLGVIEPKYYPSNDLKEPTRTIETIKSGALLVGFTATPYRTDRAPLKQVYDEVVYHKPIFDFIPDYLSDCLFANIDLELRIDGETRLASQVKQHELNQVLQTSEIKELIVDTYQEYCKTRKYSLGFASSIKEAEYFANLFCSYEIPSTTIHSKLEKEVIETRLNDFRQGDIKVLWNVNMLTEGFDFAPVDSLLICKALPSRGSSVSKKSLEQDGDLIFTQIIGRGTRRAENKTNCLILDFGALLSNEAREQMLMRTADLFGVPVTEINLNKTAEQHKDTFLKKQKKEKEIELGKLKLTELMDTQLASRYSKKKYPWVSTYHAYHLLTLSTRQHFKLVITDSSELKYDVILRNNYIDSVLAKKLELKQGVELVENYIEKNNLPIRLIDPEQQWLKLPATSAQKYALKSRKIGFKENIKRGEASHLITRYDIEISPFAKDIQKDPQILKAYQEFLPQFNLDQLLHLVSILDQGLSFECLDQNYAKIRDRLKYRAIYRIIKYLIAQDFQDMSEYFVNEKLRTDSLKQGLDQIIRDQQLK